MAFLSFTDMMENKIKANAPKGATHYHEYAQPVFVKTEYAKFIDGIRYIWNHHCNEWIPDIVDESEQPNDEFKPL